MSEHSLEPGAAVEPLTKHTGITMPMMLNNIDTDQIIPSREMKRVSKKGLSEGLFAGQRYQATQHNSRALNNKFILNQPPYQHATILLSQENFGCGSSREHAAWAMLEYGFRVIIAESFGSIFRTNCLRNGMLPVVLSKEQIIRLYKEVIKDPANNKLHVDVNEKTVTSPSGLIFSFDLETYFQEMLIGGQDFISMTLKRKEAINEFIEKDKNNRPWAYL